MSTPWASTCGKQICHFVHVTNCCWQFCAVNWGDRWNDSTTITGHAITLGSFVIRLWLTWRATVYATVTVTSRGSSLTSLWSNIYGNPWQTIRRCLRTQCNRCYCRTRGRRRGFIFEVLVRINVLCFCAIFTFLSRLSQLLCPSLRFIPPISDATLLYFRHFGQKTKPLREIVYFGSHFVVPDQVCKLQSDQSEGSVFTSRSGNVTILSILSHKRKSPSN